MSWIRTVVFAGLLTLAGCSYRYDVEAVMIDGRLAFVPNAASRGRAKCVSHVMVMPVQETRRADGESDAEWERRIYAWNDYAGYDCDDRFPIFYGQPLKGEGGPDRPDVASQPLRPGVVYEVLISAAATGYGGGRFRLSADGAVENLPGLSSSADPEPVVTP